MTDFGNRFATRFDRITGVKVPMKDCGIKCPKCGSPKTDVKESRPGSAIDRGVVDRKRTCQACNHHFRTVEISEDEIQDLQRRLKKELAMQLLDDL